MKIEKGVMVVKEGKAWGQTYADGMSTEYGWMALEDAPIHDPKYCKKPTDCTWNPANCRNPWYDEVASGKLVSVERRTEVVFRDDVHGEYMTSVL